MATNINVSIRYSSFLPVLLEIMKTTHGDVLELGAGVFSTPILHWLCQKEKRNLLTMESDWTWFYFACQYYRTDYHKFIYAKRWNYDENTIKKSWDVVLVDHSPSQRRVTEVRLLANLAKYIILHDSNQSADRTYRYSTIYPLFKYRYDLLKVEPTTTVLSNFVDLKDFNPL